MAEISRDDYLRRVAIAAIRMTGWEREYARILAAPDWVANRHQQVHYAWAKIVKLRIEIKRAVSEIRLERIRELGHCCWLTFAGALAAAIWGM